MTSVPRFPVGVHTSLTSNIRPISISHLWQEEYYSLQHICRQIQSMYSGLGAMSAPDITLQCICCSVLQADCVRRPMLPMLSGLAAIHSRSHAAQRQNISW